MHARKVQVKDGRLVLDEPTDLPDGAEVEVLVIDDELTAEERAELHASLDRASSVRCRRPSATWFAVMVTPYCALTNPNVFARPQTRSIRISLVGWSVTVRRDSIPCPHIIAQFPQNWKVVYMGN